MTVYYRPVIVPSCGGRVKSVFRLQRTNSIIEFNNKELSPGRVRRLKLERKKESPADNWESLSFWVNGAKVGYSFL